VAEPAVPSLSLSALFRRFLGFGLRAWGGPVAQLGMLKAELVDDERWVSPERFRRALSVYQLLPGPEAHEMCVWFGMLARGRAGAVLAGLGFMLPGLVLMLLLSWLYVRVGIDRPLLAAAFAGLQAAVVALVVRAVHRLGHHALSTWRQAALAAAAFALGVWLWNDREPPASASAPATDLSARPAPDAAELGAYGLRAGLLTFGGAYTAIPFLRRDAVEKGAWMTDAQFLDGLGLAGTLPAPLVIFATFVGWLGAGLAGALAITAGIFLPAFLFTLLGHGALERLTESPRLKALLAGASACVLGLIAATALDLVLRGLTSPGRLAIFGLALGALYLWRSRASIPVVVLAGGSLGLLLLR
jgi:chromate transporter